MSKERINKELISKVFCETLLRKNELIGCMSELNDCYAQSGIVLPQYSQEHVAELHAKVEQLKELYNASFKEFENCFQVDFKQYSKHVVNYFSKTYRTKVKLIYAKTSTPEYILCYLTFKNDIPELGIDKNTVINLAVIDTKKQKTNIIQQCFIDKDTNIPLLHFSSKKSRLLIPETQTGIYANSKLSFIANSFIKDNYIDEKSESMTNL